MATCCIGDSEQVNQITVAATPAVPTLLDVSPLGQRAAVAFYNAGANTVEIAANNQNITYGKGWPVPAGQALILSVGPGVKHYGVCATGLSTDVRVLEVGVSQ